MDAKLWIIEATDGEITEGVTAQDERYKETRPHYAMGATPNPLKFCGRYLVGPTDDLESLKKIDPLMWVLENKCDIDRCEAEFQIYKILDADTQEPMYLWTDQWTRIIASRRIRRQS